MLMLIKIYNATYANVANSDDLRTYLWHTQLRLGGSFMFILFAITLFGEW